MAQFADDGASSWPSLQRVAVRRDREIEALEAIREDLAEWINSLLGTTLNEHNFINDLADGVVLCDLARLIEESAANAEEKRIFAQTSRRSLWRGLKFFAGEGVDKLRPNRRARPFSFLARDNVAKFLRWCEKLGLPKVLAFESNDLVEGRNERPVLHCLLEIGRLAAQTGLATPMLVSMEMEMEEAEEEEEEGLEPTNEADADDDSAATAPAAPAEAAAAVDAVTTTVTDTDTDPVEEMAAHAETALALTGSALGLADGRIPDWCLTASEGDAGAVRLGGATAWTCSREAHSWVMVDLRNVHHVTGLVLQGDPAGTARVTQVSVLSSIDGKHWEPATPADGIAVLETDDADEHVLALPAPVSARLIKLCPLQVAGHVALRMELFGFALGLLLGVADGRLPDSRLACGPRSAASTALSPRLYSPLGWCFDDAASPIEVDLSRPRLITGLLWCTSGSLADGVVSLQTSLDNVHWSPPLAVVGSPRNPADDNDGSDDAIRVARLDPPLPAAHVRLSAHAQCPFQFELTWANLGAPLGLQSRELCDAFLSTSSSPSSSSSLPRQQPAAPTSAAHARLKTKSGWLADPEVSLFIDFGRIRLLTAVLVQSTQPGALVLSTSLGDAVWEALSAEPSPLAAADIADGRVHCIVLPAPVAVSQLRVQPRMKTHLRMECCVLDIGQPLGLASTALYPDAALSASSEQPLHSAHHARLFSSGSWRPLLTDDSPYLQVEMDAVQAVRAVVLQCSSGDCRFTLAGSIDGIFWEPYMPGKHEHLFSRPVHDESPHTFVLPVPFVARLVRLYFQPWHEDLWARLELLVGEVGSSLGLADGRIAADAITASSERDPAHTAAHARLGGSGGWQPAATDHAPSLTIDAGRVVCMRSVLSQATLDSSASASTSLRPILLSVQTSIDGVFWADMLDGVLVRVTGTPSGSPFACPIVARFLRITSRPDLLLRLDILAEPVGALFPSVADRDNTQKDNTDGGLLRGQNDSDVQPVAVGPPLQVSSSSIPAAVLAERALLWQPAATDAQPWLQISLPDFGAVHALVLRGTVTALALQYSVDGVQWTNYCAHGKQAHLLGPKGAIVGVALDDILCAAVRILPLAWMPGVDHALAAAVLVRPCGRRLGLSTGLFPAEHLTYSSGVADGAGRLLGPAAWVPADSETDGAKSFVQVALPTVHLFYGILLQGDPAATAGVTSFATQTAIDGTTFADSTGPLPCVTYATGASLIFRKPLVGSGARLCPLSWDMRPALRFELMVEELGQPAGLQTRAIADAALTSNSARSGAPATAARLHGPAGWVGEACDGSAHVQVDLGRNAMVAAVLLQGHEGLQAWSTSVSIHTSVDGRTWEGSGPNGAAQVVVANRDAGTVACCRVQPHRLVRFVRVTPQAWHAAPAIRFEVLFADPGTGETDRDAGAALGELEVEATRLCTLVQTGAAQLASLHREFSKSTSGLPDLAAILEQVRALALETFQRGEALLQALQALQALQEQGESREGRELLAAGVMDCIEDLDQRTASLLDIVRSISEQFDDVQMDLARALCIPSELQGEVLLATLQHRIDMVLALQPTPPTAAQKMGSFKSNLLAALASRAVEVGQLATLDTSLSTAMTQQHHAVASVVKEINGYANQLQRGMKIEPSERAFHIAAPVDRRQSVKLRLDLSHVAAKIDTYNKHYMQCILRLRHLSTQPSKPFRSPLPKFNHVKAKVDSRGYLPKRSPRNVIRHAPLDFSNVKSKVDSRGPPVTRRTVSDLNLSPPKPLSSRSSENALHLRKGSPHTSKPLVPYADPVDQAIERVVLACTCTPQLKVTRISKGKYVFQEADGERTVFIRVLRDHVMVRIGGGWDTFKAYMDKIDPCQRDRPAASAAVALPASPPSRQGSGSANVLSSSTGASAAATAAAAGLSRTRSPPTRVGAAPPFQRSATTGSFPRSSSFSPQASPSTSRPVSVRPAQSAKNSPVPSARSMLPRPAQRTPPAPDGQTHRSSSSPMLHPPL